MGNPVRKPVCKFFCQWHIISSADQMIQTFTFIVPILHICHCELCSRTATRLRSASMALVYNKLVQLSNLNTVSTQQVSMSLCAQ
jgi:hypothetical protein